MATFDYTSHTMASSNDFTLYPYQEQQPYPDSWSQAESQPTYSSYQDPGYMNPPTFATYPAHPAYIQPEQLAYSYKDSLIAALPSYSPAHSASHSFDNQYPPRLSAPSDSGASVQSTISSASGSPAVLPLPPNEWARSQHMSMLPDIFRDDAAAFTTGSDYETIPVTDKGCVGEFRQVPSSVSPVPPATFLSCPSSNAFLSAAREAAWTQPTSPYPPLATMSTFEPTSPNDSVFRSPSSPASAISPTIRRVMGKTRARATTSPVQWSPSASPSAASIPYGNLEVPSRPHAPQPAFTSAFSSHSSGNFVLPLESSCPSPLLQTFLSSFLWPGLGKGTRSLADSLVVDPALIQPYAPTQYMSAPFSEAYACSQAPSPVPSQYSARSPRPTATRATGSASPYMRTQSWQPYPQRAESRRPSISSVHSKHSQNSHSSEESNKGLCPIPTCGRHVKDLKAHMLTHQNERPEKCPIPTCEYHVKGFARKYDKNRHTLTHYKGTMVCGFCPGSGSAAEKSFNRADVFKRHLTSVHGVEQSPPNARRKSPANGAKTALGDRSLSGMCSTCSVTFPSAQDFYEHLDDCVLRVVQQAEPSEAINERILSSMADDQQVQETMEKHMLPSAGDYTTPAFFDEEEEVDEDDHAGEDDSNDGTYGSRSTKPSAKSRKTGNLDVSPSHLSSSSGAVHKSKKGLTHSKNGVPLTGPPAAGKGSKRRKDYPSSWGTGPEHMRMKKRVLCVYDGERRLWKDDMMLDAEHEVRIPLSGLGDRPHAWISDLDIQTLNRAESLHNATEEEKGPWIADAELESLMQ